MNDEKKLTVKERDEIRDQMNIATANMKRIDNDYEM